LVVDKNSSNPNISDDKGLYVYPQGMKVVRIKNEIKDEKGTKIEYDYVTF
jgi:hypothetical protein